jgi:hypothetical protein
MARKWCVMYGLLSQEEAQKWVAEQAKVKINGKSPIKGTPSNPRAAAPSKKRKSGELGGGRVGLWAASLSAFASLPACSGVRK